MATNILQPKVETITAELFVVKIGNKQMTVSVYNQLYYEECWDKEWNIVFPVWGKTNRDGEHLIFQKGNDLRKCRMPKNWEKLNFDNELINFIKEHKERIKLTMPSQYMLVIRELPEEEKEKASAYDLLLRITYEYNPINTITKAELEKALSVLDDVFLCEFKEIFQKRNWLYEKHEKMVDELKNSRQLFIAV